MNQILQAYAETILPSYLAELEQTGTAGGLLPAAGAFFSAALFYHDARSGAPRPLFVVSPNNQSAESLAAECLLYLPARSIAYLPGFESIPYEYSGASADIGLQRIRVLSRLLAGEQLLVFTSADALLRRIPDPVRLRERSLTLRIDDERPPRELMAGLIAMGYQREERVESPGQFALKGSVLDLYPVNMDRPVRLDYFDDFIETMRSFDPQTQLGSDREDSVMVLPAGEVVLDALESLELREAILARRSDPAMAVPAWADPDRAVAAENPDEAGEAAAAVDEGLSQFYHPGVEELYSLVLGTGSVLDACAIKPRLIMPGAQAVEEAVARIKREFHSLHQREATQRVCLEPNELLTDFPDSQTVFRLHEIAGSRLRGDAGQAGDADQSADEADQSADEADEAEESAGVAVAGPEPGARPVSGMGGRISEVRAKIFEMASAGARICITSPYSAQMRRIAGIFRQEPGLQVVVLENPDVAGGADPVSSNITGGGGARKPAVRPSKKAGKKKAAKKAAKKGKAAAAEQAADPVAAALTGPVQFADGGKPTLYIVRAAQQEGFHIPGLNFFVLTDAEIFGRSYKRRSRFKKLGTVPIESFLDLKEGDHVVHITHGVGKFVQLEKVRAAGRERDFLVLEYAEADRLFVPLDQISMVQRYIAPTERPRLDHLGKASFKKIRERVEQKIEEFAGELVQLYAVRMSKRGFQYPADTVWQEEFEAEFPHEETPDQITAIEAVKRDMEAPQPMDRLICGDVGYGKTEIAIRATFKAVMAGRQVAIIAPTTILALQHFRNFRERYRNYPISIDWISRFRSRAEIKEVKQKLLKGELDVVVGTHGLLSKDVHIKNLGLLVVDEEQRFGVSHKEAIKRMRNLVDVLTLSATPIPRTLHMSLVGIRDLSVIQTAPRDRRPVETHVMEDSDSIIREAISRELERGGQVFFLHNRIESIQGLALRVQELLPEVRIAVLHGQMLEEEIEDILLQFMERKFELLITTAIIENGIDMPNVNTLLVDRAEMFGLSQLYQIRGRVGRAGRQAYAYMLYEKARVLTETAQKRLNTILEYQELGSGFKVAMRDLEIRGAGNVIGKEQSGQIMDVGYELYVKLLDDAVRRLQGEQADSPDAAAAAIEVRSTINLRTDFYLPEDYIPDTRQRIEFYKRFEAARDEAEVDAVSAEMENRFGRLPDAAVIFVNVEKIRALASCIGFEEVYQDDQGRIRMRTGEHLLVPPQHIVECLGKIKGLSVQPGQPNTLHWAPPGRAGASLLPGADEVPEVDLDQVIGVLRRIAAPAIERRARLAASAAK